MKLSKLFINILLLVSIFIQMIPNITKISATNFATLESFEVIVESSQYYSQFEDRIIEKIVSKETNTELGLRYSVFYTLTPIDDDANVETNLIFIGDGTGEIIEAFVLNSSDDVFMINDLLEDNIVNYNLARGQVAYCIKETCTSYETRYYINYDKFCNASLGSACVSVIGNPLAYAVCRAGITIACHGVTEEKVCKQSYEEVYACAL